MINENIFQILVQGEQGETCVNWFDGKTSAEAEASAEAELKELEAMFPDCEYRIEAGTEFIYNKCRECGSVHANECSDNYGISTGYWCNDCYESDKYPYRKDAYFDESYAGERLEDDY